MRQTKRGGWPYSQPPNVPFTLNKDSPQAKGLVAWWPTLASKGANIILRDLAGPNNGTITTGAGGWVVDGILGWAYDFDGANTEVDVGTGTVLTDLPTGPYSVSCWFSADGWGEGNEGYLFGKHDGVTGWRFNLYATNNRGFFVLTYAGGARYTMCANNTFDATTDHDPHLVVYTLDASRVGHIYLDGVETAYALQQQLLAPYDSNAGNVLALGNDRFGNRAFDGWQADWRIYNRTLTDAEVYALYAPETRWELYKPLVRQVLAFVPTGAQTIGMDALTLAGATPALTQSSGAVAMAMDLLTLVGAPPALSLSLGAVSLTMDALTLASGAQGITLSLGAVSLTMDALALSSSAQGLTVSPGAVTIAADALVLASGAQSLTVGPGSVTISADALVLAGTAQGLTVTPGTVAIAMDALALAGAVPIITISVAGPVTINMDALVLASAALGLSVHVTGLAVDVIVSDGVVTTLAMTDTPLTALVMTDAVVTGVTTDDA